MPGGGEQAGVFAALEAFERYFPEGWIERAEGRAKRMVKAFQAPLEILEIGLRDIPYEGWRDYTLGMGAVLRNIIRISSLGDLGQSATSRREASLSRPTVLTGRPTATLPGGLCQCTGEADSVIDPRPAGRLFRCGVSIYRERAMGFEPTTFSLEG